MATVPFANLVSASPAHWHVEESHAAKFVDDLPDFSTEFPSLGVLLVPKEHLDFFPKKLLLRRLAIARWNEIVNSQRELNKNHQWVFNVNGKAGIYASCLSASCGMGKSMEAYLYACLARQCGWLLQYIGNGARWGIGKGEGDEISSAKLYLEMTQAFNQHIFAKFRHRVKAGTLIGETNVGGTLLGDLITRALDNTLPAAKVAREFDETLTTWTHTPILRIIDDHNLLWTKLGDDPEQWPAFYRMFADWEGKKGLRTFTVYLGSQHSKFESHIVSASVTRRHYLQPYTDEELDAVFAHPDFPAVVRAEKVRVLQLTSAIPRDIGMLVDMTRPSQGFDGTFEFVAKHYENDRFTKMEESHNEYVSSLDNEQKQLFVRAIRQVLLPTPVRPNLSFAYMDRGLLRYSASGDITFVNRFARQIVVTSYIHLWKSTTTADQMRSQFISSSGTDNGGGAFEELMFVQLLEPKHLTVVDEYGRPSPTGVSMLHIKPEDFIVLLPREHVPSSQRVVDRLIRGYARYPVWDFIYDGSDFTIFFSVSVSPFRVHDTDSAEIVRSFDSAPMWGPHSTAGRDRNQVEAILDAVTGTQGHTASIDTDNSPYEITVTKPDGNTDAPVRFVYITCQPPASSRNLPNKYRDVLFVLLRQLPSGLKTLAEERLRQPIDEPAPQKGSRKRKTPGGGGKPAAAAQSQHAMKTRHGGKP